MSLCAVVDKECLPKEDKVKICTCDLADAVCDVNCCCDPDCTKNDRRAFSTCTDKRM